MAENDRGRIPAISKENEALLQGMVEQSPNLVFLIQKGRVLYANARCEEVLGYSREELCAPGFNYLDVVCEESREQVREMAAQLIGGNDVPARECVLKTASGKKVPLFISARRVLFCGEPAVLSVANDLSAQKKMENAFLESEQRYLLTLNELTGPIHMVDRDLRVVMANDALKEWSAAMGFAVEGLPRPLEDLFPLLPRSVVDEYARVFETGKPLTTEEVTLLGDKEIYTETKKIPVFDNGAVSRIVTAIRDVTENKLKEKKLQSLNLELTESNRRLKQIVFTDPHTGLFNHRFCNEAIEHEFQRSHRKGLPFSVVLMDIDYFKSINNVYGHSFGDRVLKHFARLLKQTAGPGDTVIRYGGEEFIILLPRADRAAATRMARTILDVAGVTNFGDRKNPLRLKLSIAAASYPEDEVTQPADLMHLAESILDRAKECGGDRVYARPDLAPDGRGAFPAGTASPDIRRLKDQIGRLHKRANESLVEAIFAFARTIELKDHYTGEHVERTVYFATRIAEELGLTKEEITVVKQAAILHDLGKVGISEKILLKPARLTKKEFGEIKKHPLIGADIIRPIHLFKNIIPLILYHHERWDGKGYPRGLKGEEIPVGARVVALADAYQALISNRPYRKAYSKKEAKKIITTVSGSHFDPQVVQAFLKIA